MKAVLAVLLFVGVALAQESGWYEAMEGGCSDIPGCCCVSGQSIFLEDEGGLVFAGETVDQGDGGCFGYTYALINFTAVTDTFYSGGVTLYPTPDSSVVATFFANFTEDGVYVNADIAAHCVSMLHYLETQPTCEDGEQNGFESEIDCGLSIPAMDADGNRIPAAECGECSVIAPDDDEDDDDDLTETEQRIVGGVVGPIGGVAITTILASAIMAKTHALSAVAVGSFVALGTGTSLLILGTATDAWNTWDVKDWEGTGTHVVWQASPFVFCETESDNCLYVDNSCKIFTDPDYENRPDASQPQTYTNCTTLRAVRALAVLACVFGFISWLLALVAPCTPNQGVKKGSMSMGLIGAVFGLTGMAIWADEVNRDQGWFNRYNSDEGPYQGSGYSQWEYDYSFGLFTTGWVLVFLGALLVQYVESKPKSGHKTIEASRPAQATQMTAAPQAAPAQDAAPAAASSTSAAAPADTTQV